MITVEVKCVGCGERRTVKAGEIPEGDHPICTICFNPMVAAGVVASLDNDDADECDYCDDDCSCVACRDSI